MGSRESLPAVAGHGGREKSGSSRQYTIPLSRFGPRRCVKPYSCFGGLYACVLELAMGREELQKAESSSWSPGASFYRERGCHSGTQEVERVQSCEVIPRITCQGAFNAPCLGVLALSGAGESPVSSVATLFRVDTRPGQRCLRCHVGGQAAEVAQRWVSSRICMPPRRRLPSWLGWQLHANGGGGVTGAGPMVAPRVSLARALPRPRQGSCRDLAVAPAAIPGKALAG